MARKCWGRCWSATWTATATCLQLKLNDMDLPDKPEALILPAMEGSPRKAFGPDALPMTAVICSCNNVTKGDICTAIDGGVKDLPGLKAATKLATSCGGCSALAGSVLKCELEKRGVEVKKDLVRTLRLLASGAVPPDQGGRHPHL
jgi:nitrite reductase (NADH) large subunit